MDARRRAAVQRRKRIARHARGVYWFGVAPPTTRPPMQNVTIRLSSAMVDELEAVVRRRRQATGDEWTLARFAREALEGAIATDKATRRGGRAR